MTTNHIQLKNSFQSYLFVIIMGLFAGVITRLTDFFPNNDLWSLSSIATLFGFWIVTTTLVIYFSSSNINAAINSFLYLFAMSFSFYILEYVLGLFFPRFSNDDFRWNLFIMYSIGSIVCGIIGFVLYFWNKDGKAGSVLYALPVGGLLAETIGVFVYFCNERVFLFQLLFNVISASIMGLWFYKKSKYKLIYICTCLAVCLVGYFLFYRLFL